MTKEERLAIVSRYSHIGVATLVGGLVLIGFLLTLCELTPACVVVMR